MDPQQAPFPPSTCKNYASFTPVRRPEALEVQNTPEGPQAVAWTSAKCKRLLRPLSSRIGHIRKHRTGVSEATRLGQQTESFLPIEAAGPVSFTNVTWGKSIIATKGDSDWEPDDAPRKKLKRTYSMKVGSAPLKGSASHDQRVTVGATNVEIPSPLVARHNNDSGGKGMSIESQSNLVRNTATNDSRATSIRLRDQSWTLRRNPRDAFRRLARLIAPSQWILYDGLYSALDTLLKTTSRTNAQSKPGAPSLLSICFRKLPAYMAEEQAYVESEDLDSLEDVPSSIYSDLEFLTSANSGGWKPLREIVRAHGIFILCTAVEDGSLISSVARGLVILCLQNSAHFEAESLVKSMIKIVKTVPLPMNNHDRLFSPGTSSALQALWDISSRTGQHHLLFWSLASLLDSGVLPVQWISTQDMIDVWNRALRSIARNEVSALGAMALIRTTMRRLSCNANLDVQSLFQERSDSWRQSHGRVVVCSEQLRTSSGDDSKPSAAANIMINVLTVISSAIYSRTLPGHEISMDDDQSQRLLRSLAIDSLQMVYMIERTDNTFPVSFVPAVGSHLPPLALLLCSRSERLEALRLSSLEKLCSTLLPPQKDQDSNAFSGLLCSIADCCSHMTGLPSFIILQRLIARLDSSIFRTSIPSQKWITQIALTTAFDFAEATSKQDHLDWALRIEEALGKPITDSTERTSEETEAAHQIELGQKTTFRWEDSISEWVACTPAVAITKARVSKVDAKPSLDAIPTDASAPGSLSDHEDVENNSLRVPLQTETPLPSRAHARPLLSDISPLVVVQRSHSITLSESNDLHANPGFPAARQRHYPHRKPQLRFRSHYNRRRFSTLEALAFDENDDVDADIEDQEAAKDFCSPNKDEWERGLAMRPSSTNSSAVDSWRSQNRGIEVRVPLSFRSSSVDQGRLKLRDITNEALCTAHKPRIIESRTNELTTDIDWDKKQQIAVTGRPRISSSNSKPAQLRFGKSKGPLQKLGARTGKCLQEQRAKNTSDSEESVDELCF